MGLTELDLMELDLGPWCNNVGMTTDEHRDRGNFDGCGGSYPFDDLSHLVGRPGGLAAGCTGHGRPDNVACEGQTMTLSLATPVDRCLVLGSAEGSMREPVTFADPHGREIEVLVGLTDFLAAGPAFGEHCLVTASHLHRDREDVLGPRPRLWRADLRLPPLRPVRMVLPENPLMHIFAITVAGSPEPR